MAHHDKHRSLPRRATASVIAIIAASALGAGCGSNSHKSTTSSSSGGAQLAFSKCMRAHGVPSFPDPGAKSGAAESSFAGIAIPPTIDTQSPAFRSAESSCRHLISAILSPQGKPPITDRLKTSLIAKAHCMRTHGVPAYPDPRFPASGGIEIFDSPAVDPQSPAYKHAEALCGNPRR